MMNALNKGLLLCLLTCLGSLGSEIFNGKKVPENLMLYMASLQNDTGHHICGGFLINESFVLSAAHCYNKTPISVVLGTHNLLKVNNETMRYKAEPCLHPSFKDVKHGDDIMLLKLEKKAQLNKRVKTLQLPRSETKIKDNDKCCVAGWGKTKAGGKSVNVLQFVNVSVVNLKTCKKDWGSQRLPPNVICTGGDAANKGFCKGDSGGPLVCGGVAAGVVSFMHGDCRYPNAPSIYTNISKYLPWIKQILKRNRC